ncbi:MAG: hypothetical protein Q4F72_11185 [Desulfovibrionaceae bacterium]|nr:hypothetical protein [Desulfovibrionaceae bacterium]
MREIYVFENAAQPVLRPAAEAAGVDPVLLQAAQGENFDWMEPMFAGGSPEHFYLTVFKQPKKAGGIVVVFYGGEEAMFCAIANSNLDLLACASHFSSMVSNVRYGVDIFENAGDDED